MAKKRSIMSNLEIDQLTPCDATVIFTRGFDGYLKSEAITQCCLFKEQHSRNGKRLKHLSLLVQATVGGEQWPGTEGWSYHMEEA